MDTNILVYAQRHETPQHEVSLSLVRGLAEGQEPFVLLWPVLYEFTRVVTHPGVFNPPTPVAAVVADVERLLASPAVSVVGETPRHASWFGRVLKDGNARGNLAFDAHIVALMREHGIDEIITSDRDFLGFKGIRVTNPLA